MADVTGTQFADDARDLLIARLNGLVTDGASDDPNLSYVYDRHHRSNVQLNAASVDLDFFVHNWQGQDEADGSAVLWILNFSIRVHTGRMGYIVDGRKTTRLMESICNKLWSQWKLDANHHIQTIPTAANYQRFEESRTIGGAINVTVHRMVSYSQE